MANDTLSLSDIMHTMSPSPAPIVLVEDHSTPKNSTPEPLTEMEIILMRRKVSEMGLKINSNSRERELGDMVLRLTASTLLDPSQLVRQADTISGLIVQRDYLMAQVEEERSRWESERESWGRIAEALIAQRNRHGNTSAKDEELERQCASFESDNRALRERLQDTQTRLSCLESELSKLKPLLLMQPFPSSSSQTLASLTHASTFMSSIPFPSVHNVAKPKNKKKKKENRVPVASASMPDDHDMSDETNLALNPEQQPTAGPSSGDHYRKPEITVSPLTVPSAKKSRNHHQHTKSSKRSHHSTPLLPLTSDARSEHLLLAARKIGRERAGIVAGLVRERQHELDRDVAERLEQAGTESREKDREQEKGSYYRKEAVESNPKTPKKGGHYPQAVASVSNPGYEFESENGRMQAQNHNNPQTPLDSLLSAARSMMVEGEGGDDEASNATTNGRRRSSAIELPDSPLPKRRRISGGRVKSALDVLADQAAAFSSTDQPRVSNGGRGKGKAREGEIDEDYDGENDVGTSVRTKGRAAPVRKTRPKAAPRERKQPLRKGKDRAGSGSGSATPRVISIPGLSRGEDMEGGVSAPLRDGDRISPLDSLPPVKKAASGIGHAPWRDTSEPRSNTKLSLRPVTQWGERDEEGSPGRGGDGDAETEQNKAAEEVERQVENVGDGGNDGDETAMMVDIEADESICPELGVEAEKPKTQAETIPHGKTDARSYVVTQISDEPAGNQHAASQLVSEASIIQSVNGDLHVITEAQNQAVDMDLDADADADDDEQDAEGEKEDEDEPEPEVSQTRPPPSRTPPPPAPPPSGPNSNGPDLGPSEGDEDDDADAEGDMDLEAEDLSHSTFPAALSTDRRPIDMDLTVPGPVAAFELPSVDAAIPLAAPISLSVVENENQQDYRYNNYVYRQNASGNLELSTEAEAQGGPSPSTTMKTSAEEQSLTPMVIGGNDIGDSWLHQPRGGNTPDMTVFSTPGRLDAGTNMFGSSDGGLRQHPDVGRVGGHEMQMGTSGKRPRSPYVKWNKEEDDLLAEAVAKYGQKWDMVQKALPSRGYHQVRQRWLRKLGVFDSKPDLSSFQTGFPATPGVGAVAHISNESSSQRSPPPNPRLGLAPLSSELAFSGLSRISNGGTGPDR